MAYATCLHFNPLAHTLRPFLHRRTPLLRPPIRRLLTSAGLHVLSSDRYKRSVQPVFAQARRSFSSMAKEEAVASLADLLFERPLKILEYPDPILRAKNKRVSTFDESLKKLVDEMFDVMYRTDGIGLSAPQVGINVELMVFNSVGERGEGEEIVLINPHIKRYSRKIVPFNEGCLSFPGIYADVKRPDALQVDAQDVTGARFEVNLTGLPARVFQHEHDHLQGILFFDRMSDEALESVCAEIRKCGMGTRENQNSTICLILTFVAWHLHRALERNYEERTRLSSPERIDARRKKKKAVGFGKS